MEKLISELHLTKTDFIVGFLGWLLRAVYNWYNARHKINTRAELGVIPCPFSARTYLKENGDMLVVSAIAGLGLLFILPQLCFGLASLFGMQNITWNSGFSGLLGVLGFDALNSLFMIAKNRLALLEHGNGFPSVPPAPCETSAEETPAGPPPGTGGVVPVLLLCALAAASCSRQMNPTAGPPVQLQDSVPAGAPSDSTQQAKVPAADSAAQAQVPAVLPQPAAPKASGVLGFVSRVLGTSGRVKNKNVTYNVVTGTGNNLNTAGKNANTATGAGARTTAVDKPKAATAAGDGAAVSDAHDATNAAMQQGGTGNTLKADQKAKGTAAKKSMADALFTPTGYVIAACAACVVAGCIWYVWNWLPARRKKRAEEQNAVS